MARLPTVGGDKGNWGDILNDYLKQSHADDGTLKSEVVGSDQLAPDAVMTPSIGDGQIASAKIADAAIGANQLADNAVTSTKLSGAGQPGGIATLGQKRRAPRNPAPRTTERK